jgi:hypothetical protein
MSSSSVDELTSGEKAEWQSIAVLLATTIVFQTTDRDSAEERFHDRGAAEVIQ